MNAAILKPHVHEAGAHLLFADPDDPDDPGLGRYFGFVSQFDRSFKLAKEDATLEAADETWRFNHNPEDGGPSINYWEGKNRADGQSYDAYYEYNIPMVAVDETEALGKWARRYAVTVDDADPDALEIAINLGELTEYQLVKIVRAGYSAAKVVGSRAAQQFTNARIRYMTADGGYRTA